MSELDMPVDTSVEEALGYLHGATFDMPGGAEAVKTVRAEIGRLRENNHRLGLLRVEAESERDRLLGDLTGLITRHTGSEGEGEYRRTVEYGVSVAELHNVVAPGSREMKPARPGYTATCGICAPDGDPS